MRKLALITLFFCASFYLFAQDVTIKITHDFWRFHRYKLMVENQVVFKLRYFSGKKGIAKIFDENGKLIRKVKSWPYTSHPQKRKIIEFTRNDKGRKLTKTVSIQLHRIPAMHKKEKTYKRAK
jgi:hypothetical protein